MLDERVTKNLVSIIVPIYNTEDFIGRCVASLIHQTYRNLEIILLDDGSQDTSHEKCMEWAKMDNRIIVVHKKNECQGPTRDKGAKLASGEYLMFVDSDDWVEADYVELLYNSISSANCDVAFCDMDYVIPDQQGNYIHSVNKCKVQLENAISPADMPEIIYYIDCSLCNKIYRNEFWQTSNIVQYKDCGEDICVSTKLLPLAKRISQVKKVLYHYCKNDESTTQKIGYEKLLSHSLDIIKAEMDKRPPEEGFKYPIKKMVSSVIPYNTFTTSIVKNREKRSELKEKFEKLFICEYDLANAKSAVWGSFNLRCAVKEYTYFIPDTYSFSGLISLMSSEIHGISVFHPNSFRQEAIQKDICKEFLGKMQEYDCIYIDFLEERYDVVEVGKDSYVTKSEAWSEADKNWTGSVVNVTQSASNFWQLWQDACNRFVAKLKVFEGRYKVILVKTRLAEWYGNEDKKKQFTDHEEIRLKNRIIGKMEKYFLDKYPKAIVVEDIHQKFHYTDVDFPYGCSSHHLNGYWYREMGRVIRNTMEGNILGELYEMEKKRT